MKIYCTKAEFEELLSSCNPGEERCEGCVLEEMCDSRAQMAKMCTLQEVTNE